MPDPTPQNSPSANATSTPDKYDPSQQDDVIHVLRTTQQHHVMLGMIADRKANIILGAFLIFITLSQGILEKNTTFDTPIWILTAFFTAAALFSLMVIAPRFINKKQADKPNNLLFFGCFVDMSQEEYIEHLSDHLQENTMAREMMMKDIYQIGKVLNKKYKNLRYSYLSLGIGILGSVGAFAVVGLMQ
jgi:hypothetical protein